MDLLVKLASDKAKALTYAFNNHKIKRIVKIQADKEKIEAVADRMRKHLIDWRKATLSVLNTDYKAVIDEQRRKEFEQLKELQIQEPDKTKSKKKDKDGK